MSQQDNGSKFKFGVTVDFKGHFLQNPCIIQALLNNINILMLFQVNTRTACTIETRIYGFFIFLPLKKYLSDRIALSAVITPNERHNLICLFDNPIWLMGKVGLLEGCGLGNRSPKQASSLNFCLGNAPWRKCALRATRARVSLCPPRGLRDVFPSGACPCEGSNPYPVLVNF